MDAGELLGEEELVAVDDRHQHSAVGLLGQPADLYR